MGKCECRMEIYCCKRIRSQKPQTDWITQIVIAGGWFLLMALLEIRLHAHNSIFYLIFRHFRKNKLLTVRFLVSLRSPSHGQVNKEKLKQCTKKNSINIPLELLRTWFSMKIQITFLPKWFKYKLNNGLNIKEVSAF